MFSGGFFCLPDRSPFSFFPSKEFGTFAGCHRGSYNMKSPRLSDPTTVFLQCLNFLRIITPDKFSVLRVVYYSSATNTDIILPGLVNNTFLTSLLSLLQIGSNNFVLICAGNYGLSCQLLCSQQSHLFFGVLLPCQP